MVEYVFVYVPVNMYCIVVLLVQWQYCIVIVVLCDNTTFCCHLLGVRAWPDLEPGAISPSTLQCHVTVTVGATTLYCPGCRRANSWFGSPSLFVENLVPNNFSLLGTEPLHTASVFLQNCHYFEKGFNTETSINCVRVDEKSL